MITIISGNPGNGKTLRAVQLLILEKSHGKLTFQKNLTGCSADVATEWDRDLSEWQTLPMNSVLAVDEAQDFAKTEGKAGSPKWVLDLSKHRKYGVDFIFVTQDPRFLDPWIRRLCGQHIHMARKAGLQGAVIHEWDRCREDTGDYHALQASSKTIWKFPKPLYQLYKSSQIHTVKRRIPWMWFALPIGILIALSLGLYGTKTFFHHDSPKEVASKTANGTRAAKLGVEMSGTDLIKKFTPTVHAWGWSAPAYSALKPSDYPVPMCMVMHHDETNKDDCQCITQQGTKYNVENKICIQIATDGVFDPFRSERKDLKENSDRDRYSRFGERGEQSAQPEARFALNPDVGVPAPASADSLDLASLQRPVGSGSFGAGPRTNASGPIAPTPPPISANQQSQSVESR